MNFQTFSLKVMYSAEVQIDQIVLLLSCCTSIITIQSLTDSLPLTDFALFFHVKILLKSLEFPTVLHYCNVTVYLTLPLSDIYCLAHSYVYPSLLQCHNELLLGVSGGRSTSPYPTTTGM